MFEINLNRQDSAAASWRGSTLSGIRTGLILGAFFALFWLFGPSRPSLSHLPWFLRAGGVWGALYGLARPLIRSRVTAAVAMGLSGGVGLPIALRGAGWIEWLEVGVFLGICAGIVHGGSGWEECTEQSRH